TGGGGVPGTQMRRRGARLEKGTQEEVAAARAVPQRMTMAQKKTLRQRQEELQALLATPAGRAELQELESRYEAAGGKLRPAGTSVITYLLVHEREQGLIAG